MPLAAMASAVSRISCSLTLQPKWFQEFQPMGGVRARPLSSRAAGAAPNAAAAQHRARARRMAGLERNLVAGRRDVIEPEVRHNLAQRPDRVLVREFEPAGGHVRR